MPRAALLHWTPPHCKTYRTSQVRRGLGQIFKQRQGCDTNAICYARRPLAHPHSDATGKEFGAANHRAGAACPNAGLSSRSLRRRNNVKPDQSHAWIGSLLRTGSLDPVLRHLRQTLLPSSHCCACGTLALVRHSVERCQRRSQSSHARF